jgi:hypothetical protein
VIAFQPPVLLKGALSAQGQAPCCDDTSEMLLVLVAIQGDKRAGPHCLALLALLPHERGV